MTAAVVDAEPDVVIHQATALADGADLKHFDRVFAQTNRLRTRGTDDLLEAARVAGVTRLIAQSFTGWPNERSGAPVKDETDPLDPHPTAPSRQTMAAIRHQEAAVVDAAHLTGVALRYGGFYGPATGIATDGEVSDLVRRRRLPVVGGGRGIWSFVHIDDAARATYDAMAAGSARRRDDDLDPRLVERRGPARAGLAAGPSELARGLPDRAGLTAGPSAYRVRGQPPPVERQERPCA